MLKNILKIALTAAAVLCGTISAHTGRISDGYADVPNTGGRAEEYQHCADTWGIWYNNTCYWEVNGNVPPEAYNQGYDYAAYSWNENYYYPDYVDASLYRGNAGRLYMPNGWSVPLYYDPGDFQSVVDAWDSALVRYGNGMNYGIYDHSNQGFGCMRWYGVGSQCAIIDEYGTLKIYQCVAYYPDMTDWSYTGYWYSASTGFSVGRSDSWGGQGDICMQTCNDASGQNDTVSYWAQIQ